MMEQLKGVLRLLVILLVLSHLLFALAVPATRSPRAREVDPSHPHHLTQKDHVEELKKSGEQLEMEEGNGEGRMMMYMIDYSNAKANPAHDPKSPGKP